MLTVRVTESGHTHDYEHAGGGLEIGRGPQRDLKRVVVKDTNVSRDQMLIEPLAGKRIRIHNLSRRQPVLLADAGRIAAGESRELALPVRFTVGKTQFDLFDGTAPVDRAGGLQ